MRTPVHSAAVDLPVEHHHLPIDAVEGPQPEATVPEQLADGRIAVVAASQQTGDRGNWYTSVACTGTAPVATSASASTRHIIARIMMSSLRDCCELSTTRRWMRGSWVRRRAAARNRRARATHAGASGMNFNATPLMQ